MYLGVVGNGKTEYDSVVYGRRGSCYSTEYNRINGATGLDFEDIAECHLLLWLRQCKKVINIVIKAPKPCGKKV